MSAPPFSTLMADLRVKVDKSLDAWLPPADISPKKLHEAMRYSVFAGGKRIRPILCLLVAEAFGQQNTETIKAACALELLHTYSLIHDDLPAMDDDDLRRGRPTNHKVYGEALAILAGDALLTLSFEWLAQLSPSGISCEQSNALIATFARAVGHQGMVGGQALDMSAEGKAIDLDDLQAIHKRKTGALLAVAIEFGTILGSAPAHVAEAFARFGQELGMLFQIVDDILDVEGVASSLGKTPGSDERCDKATYVTVTGLERAKKISMETADRARMALHDTGLHLPALEKMIDFLQNRQT